MKRYILLGIGAVFFSVTVSIFIVIGYIKNRTIKEYYGDGKIKIAYTVRKGKIEGTFLEYYPNGTVKANVFYEKGIKEDTFRLFHENGALQELSVYVNGKKSGLYKEFYADHTLKVSGWAKNDFKDSVFLYYSPTGALDSVVKYNLGKSVQRFLFSEHYTDYVDGIEKFRLRFANRWKPVWGPKAPLILRNSESEQTDATQTITILKYKHVIGTTTKSVVESYIHGVQAEVPSFKVNAMSFSEDRCLVSYTSKYETLSVEGYISIHVNDENFYVINCSATTDAFHGVDEDFRYTVESFQFVAPQTNPKISTI